MSREAHDDTCADCRPALVLPTGVSLPDDAPSMQIVLRVWGTLTLAEKQAWHRFTCQNSRDPLDVQSAAAFTQCVQAALTKGESHG